MTSNLDRYETAMRARDRLITQIAQASVRAAHDIGVEFDEPRVVRWLILTMFEGMFMAPAKTTSRELLAITEKASDGESRFTSWKKKKGEPGQPIVTWKHLVAWADADPRHTI